MNISTSTKGGITTPDATPMFGSIIPLTMGVDQNISVDMYYGCNVSGDHTKFTFRHVTVSFYYTSATGIVRSSVSDDAALLEYSQSTQSPMPSIQFVPDNANKWIALYFNGTVDVLNWGLAATIYEW